MGTGWHSHLQRRCLLRIRKVLHMLPDRDKVRIPMYAIFVWHSSYRVRSASLLFLCVCVVLQMLGVPATLLDPAGSADSFAAAALEGLSLPPTPLTLYIQSRFSIALEVPLAADVPILLDSFFHPPLS